MNSAITTSYALGLPGLLAIAGYGVAALPAELDGRWRVALLVGWLLHAVAIAVDISGFGTGTAGARFGFAPALSVTMWLVIAVYGVESRFVPLPNARRVLACLGALAVALALAYPGDLMPQASSRWAPLHWMLGIASYALFGAAVLHGVLLNRAERLMRAGRAAAAGPGPGLPLLRLERLTFWFVGAGFVVLSAAIVLGALFASPWRWDHKTVLSVLGWAVFASLLAGRQLFGWRGHRATRWLYAGAALLLLAYAGSRFVFEVLLQRAPGA
ncbi:MAG: cytochrome C assembly protein [Methylibium sp. NZG]|nr:MAG: cytochrome C assembly protein [Methylibium sp. NZG]